eukprot:7744796-Heterocapsa_arctica.AAC.1
MATAVQNDAWKDWSQSEAYDAPARTGYQGIPEGSERIEETNMWRNQSSDFMYLQVWVPPGEEFRQEGRNFLTK